MIHAGPAMPTRPGNTQPHVACLTGPCADYHDERCRTVPAKPYPTTRGQSYDAPPAKRNLPKQTKRRNASRHLPRFTARLLNYHARRYLPKPQPLWNLAALFFDEKLLLLALDLLLPTPISMSSRLRICVAREQVPPTHPPTKSPANQAVRSRR